jgi:hypothetical protein
MYHHLLWIDRAHGRSASAPRPFRVPSWRAVQDESANWSIVIAAETYNGPAPTARSLPIWEVLEAVDRPLRTGEIAEKIQAKQPNSPVNRDLIRQAVHHMYKCGYLFCYECESYRKWQLAVCRRSWKAEFRATF